MTQNFHQGQALPVGAPDHVKAKPSGMKWPPFILVLLIGTILWFIPPPEGVALDAWHLLAIFVSTIVAIILKPLPMGAVALMGLGVTALTHTLPVEEVFSGFANAQIWLIVLACFIARGFIKTGLASRISYMFLYFFGRSPLGLAYGFLASDLIMAPVIPSSTARAGGVLIPIIRSLSETLGSRPDDGTAKRIGSFLALSTFQVTVVTSTMFVTAMAPNPIIVRLAQDGGVEITWLLWAKAAIVPGLLSLAAIPVVTSWICPPTIKDVSDAAAHSKEHLAKMGKMTRPEWMMSACFIMLLVMWIGGQSLSINATVAAVIGVSFLMVTDVLNWRDILGEEIAWDTLIWFSVLVMMAGNLNALGFISWLSDQIVVMVEGYHWTLALGILGLVYFYSHYFFASITAHVTSMFASFMMVCVAIGGPPLLVALSLAFLSGLMGGLTHYSSGQAPVIFAYRFVDLKMWWKVGFILSIVYLVIWAGIGTLWWSWLGLW
ncbi:MAG: anion permease [Chlamydiales bacterium]|nr:anion permease [Chlamydiales bacterium]